MAVETTPTEVPVALLTEQMVRRNCIEEIERLLEEAEERAEGALLVNRPIAQWNQNPLHVAATEGHFDLICLFLQHGADINKKDRNDWSPLHCAAKHSHLEVTQIFLSRHADITLRNDSGVYMSLCWKGSS